MFTISHVHSKRLEINNELKLDGCPKTHGYLHANLEEKRKRRKKEKLHCISPEKEGIEPGSDPYMTQWIVA